MFPGEASIVQIIVYSPVALHTLGEVIGEQSASLVSVAGAMIVSLCDIYLKGSTMAFVLCFLSTMLGVLVSCLSVRVDDQLASNYIKTSKLFVAVSNFSGRFKVPY